MEKNMPDNNLTTMPNTRVAWREMEVEFHPSLQLRQALRSLIRSVVMDCRNQMSEGFGMIEHELLHDKPFSREWHAATEEQNDADPPTDYPCR